MSNCEQCGEPEDLTMCGACGTFVCLACRPPDMHDCIPDEGEGEE